MLTPSHESQLCCNDSLPPSVVAKRDVIICLCIGGLVDERIILLGDADIVGGVVDTAVDVTIGCALDTVTRLRLVVQG